MDHHRSSRFGRRGLVVLAAVVGLLATTASPAGALGSWNITEPGVHTHTGYPYQPPGPNNNPPPCARYHHQDFNAEASGNVSVLGYTFEHAVANVTSDATRNGSAMQWDENPSGSFHPYRGTQPGGGCSPTLKATGGNPIRGLRTTITGTSDGTGGGNRDVALRCNGVDGAYWRDVENNNFEFTTATCIVTLPDGRQLVDDVFIDYNLNYLNDPVTGATLCNSPIAPTTCYSDGTITIT